jgi:hypothetical protein
MKHVWKLLSPGDAIVQPRYRCDMCGLERDTWPILGLWRPWPFNHCTGYHD